MPTPLLDLLDDDTLVISPSGLEVIKTCLRMYQWKYLYRREKVGAFAARDGGKAFDTALNERYTKLGSAPVLVNSPIETEMNNLIDAGFEGLDLPFEEYRTATYYKELLREYNKTFQREPFNVLGVQVPIAVELGEIPCGVALWQAGIIKEPRPIKVILKGILDLLVEQDGGIYVFDTKTMNQWSNAKLTEWENASQPKAYAWGVQKLARENPSLGLPDTVRGFILNAVVLRKPSDSARVKLPRIEFHRPTFHYIPERLEEWRKDALAWIGIMLDCVAKDHYPQNEKHCAMHYGKPCSYLDVCMAPKSQREMVLGMDLFQDYQKGPI
jgi:hypothetical protein